LSQLGSVHINNVHILANLEPFRYGSPDFIQKTVKAMHAVHGAKGLHLYPQASYWIGHIQQIKLLHGCCKLIEIGCGTRPGAVCMECNRSRAEEIVYQSKLLGNFYGCTEEHGKYILEAYEQAGEIAPKLIRRFGITMETGKHSTWECS